MIEFLAANWIWIVFVIGMIAMHRHGGCGSHTHGHHAKGESHGYKDSTPSPPAPVSESPGDRAPVGGARAAGRASTAIDYHKAS